MNEVQHGCLCSEIHVHVAVPDSCLLFHVVPTAPNLLRVIASGPGDLTVTWEEPSSTNGEIINYNISVNVRAMVIESSGMGTEFVVTGLEPFTDYSVRVQACTSEGCGPFSNEIMNATLQEGEICIYNTAMLRVMIAYVMIIHVYTCTYHMCF